MPELPVPFDPPLGQPSTVSEDSKAVPEEAVQAAAEWLKRQYESTFSGGCPPLSDFEFDARDFVKSVAPILATQVRRETADQIAEAITGSICGPAAACANRACSDCARYMQAQEDAIIARQIGDARDSR